MAQFWDRAWGSWDQWPAVSQVRAIDMALQVYFGAKDWRRTREEESKRPLPRTLPLFPPQELSDLM